MKIGYVSDTHLDFFVHPNKNHKIREYIQNILNPEGGDVLIVAGDISHYNTQTILLLEELSTYYNQVLFTIGNHDLYLISKNLVNKYKYNSFSRIKELEDYFIDSKFIHFLNGSSIDINGVNFGGLPNWYDLPSQGHIDRWNNIMNDSNLIYEGREHTIINYGYYSEKLSSFDTQAFRKIQEENFEKLENIDVLFTHICPCLIDPENKNGPHSSDDMFYMTDDIEKVKKTGAKYVVYGHNHTSTSWSKDSIKFLTNSIGYPKEWMKNPIKHFEIKG